MRTILDRISDKQREKFWMLAQEKDGCLVWQGWRHRTGYGAFALGEGKGIVPAHRAAYALATNTEPGSLYVLHRCDNPLCIKPEHLFLGTYYDNMRDMFDKGRVCRGSRHRSARLKESDIACIRASVAAGATLAEVAKQYGVSTSTIFDVSRGRTWKWVGVVSEVTVR